VILRVRDPATWGPSIEAAAAAVARGEAILLPTDTVYGIGCDPYSAEAVARMLAAKGRGRTSPPPVLAASTDAALALAQDPPDVARALAEAFWPGPLTIVVRARPEIRWDLGDTGGTVALRVPADAATIALLERAGPLAVTSANLTGEAPATTADEAEEALGGSVTVVLDGGPSPVGEPSTIVDVTGTNPRILRLGALSARRLESVLGEGALATRTGAVE
jgi:L-threonylcarbamoyladenylate synthase